MVNSSGLNHQKNDTWTNGNAIKCLKVKMALEYLKGFGLAPIFPGPRLPFPFSPFRDFLLQLEK